MSKPFLLALLSQMALPSLLFGGMEPATPDWNGNGGMDIIPCPKVITRDAQGRNIELKSGAKVAISIPESHDVKLSTAAALIESELKSKANLQISILKGGRPETNVDATISLAIKSGLSAAGRPIGDQGYLIEFPGGNAIALSAQSSQGLLYAASTLTQMAVKSQDGAAIPRNGICDWPDFKHRMTVGLKINSFEAGRRLVDFCAKYKFDMLLSDMPNTSHETLRKVNDYAASHGVAIMYFTTWSLGNLKEHANDPRFKGCVQYAGNYYCWSDDALLVRRIEELASFVRETKAECIGFHCVDSYEENWPERCEGCRKRFGDDRAAADAHVISSITNALRNILPDIKLSFVTQPYGIDLGLQGNEQFMNYYARLTKLLPDGICLNATGYNHDAAANWNKTVKQPLVRWQNGSTFQIGRFFDTAPSLFKGVYFQERDDIAFINEPVDFFDGDIMDVIGVEYMWNTNAPGSAMLLDSPVSKIKESGPYKYRSGMIDGKSIDTSALDGSGFESSAFDPVREPKAAAFTLLNRVCLRLYGPQIASDMADYLRCGVKGWRHVSVASSFTMQAEDQAIRCAKACAILEAALKKDIGAEDRAVLSRFRQRTAPPKLFYDVQRRFNKCMDFVKAGDLDNASKALTEANDALVSGKAAFGNNALLKGIDIDKWTETLDSQARMLSCRIALDRRRMARTSGGCVKVALYNPNETGGKAFPHETIYNTLARQDWIELGVLGNLTKELLVPYDVLVFPQISSFPEKDRDGYKEVVRWFVMEKGGGAYFEHDAVGFHRSATPSSLFPEICKGGGLRVESFKATVVASHPALAGLQAGESVEHMYWDHITLNPGPDGETLAVDLAGRPVIVVGKAGKGRVLFTGTVTLGRNDKEKESAELLDKALLSSGILWLSGKDCVISPSGSACPPMSLTLPADRKWIDKTAMHFPVEPGAEYFMELSCVKTGNVRLIPMIVAWGDDVNQRREFSMPGFPGHDEIKEFKSFMGIIKIPNSKDLKNGSLRLFMDWYGGDTGGEVPGSASVKDVILIKL